MKENGKTLFGVVFVIALFVGAILLAQNIQDNTAVQELISSFGILGILLVSFIGGLNLVVPIPATAFIPIFSAAGFALPLIISIIVIGTTIADLLSYYLGTVVREHVNAKKNRIYRFVKKWCEGKPIATRVIVFLYAALIPLPNELLLLPLGTLGVKLKNLVPAFILGTTFHVTALAYGLTAFT